RLEPRTGGAEPHHRAMGRFRPPVARAGPESHGPPGGRASTARQGGLIALSPSGEKLGERGCRAIFASGSGLVPLSTSASEQARKPAYLSPEGERGEGSS